MRRADADIGGLPFAFAAAITPAESGTPRTTTVRAMRHGPTAISLEMEGTNSLGLTIWANGNAEMTWPEGTGGTRPNLQQYVICSDTELDAFLHDLRVRLHG